MDGLLRDIRFTRRNMGRSPGLAVAIAISLALGIGANTAIFSLIRAVLLKSLPVQEPERLVLFYWGADQWPTGLNQSGTGGPRQPAWRSTSRSLAFPLVRALAGASSVFSSVFAFAPLGAERENTTLAAGGTSERVDGEMVSGAYFRGLGVTPAAGRLIGDDDERGAVRVAVLSHGYWMRRFGGDPAIVGQSISVNNLPFDVIGIAPRGFFGVQPGRMPDVWIPMLDAPELVPWGFRPSDTPSLLTARAYWWVHVMARLGNGVDDRQARTAADAIFQPFVADALPRAGRDRSVHLELEKGAGGLDIARGAFERPLYVLLGMVALVLVIACANVAVLLLSRAMSRRREFALRLSLGAPRRRLIRQLLTESLLMAGAGGLLGVLCAGWTSRALLYLLPAQRRPLIDGQIDPAVLTFAALVSAGTALLFGLVPAIVSTRVDVLPALKQSSGAISDRPAHRAWSTALVAIQVALSLVLLAGAGLFIRTLSNLQRESLGIEDSRLLVFGVDASQNGYAGDRLPALYAQIIERLGAQPGVEGVTATRNRLFSGWVSSGGITIAGEPPKPSGMQLQSNAVGPNITGTLGLRLSAGRDITWTDIRAGRRVAVINDAMVRYFFADANPLGRRFNFGDRPDEAAGYEIVGIVSNAKYSRVRGEFPRTAYVPYTASRSPLKGLYLYVRASGDPLALIPSARAAVHAIDPNVALVDMNSMRRQIGDSIWQERLFARLTSAFGLLALTLACVGLYGTISYGVSRRRAEIAVRMAMGARHTQVLWMVLRQSIALTAVGIAAGIPLALWSGRFVSSLMFGLTPRDPITLISTALILVLVAAGAGYIPARRAALVDPAAALKQE